MALFDNSEPEEFLLFIRNFNTTLDTSGMFVSSSDIQYLCTLVRGRELHQFYTLSDELRSTTSENLKSNILGLSTYFFLVNALSKQNRAMRRGMRKLRVLKVRRYAVCMIDLNKYLAVLPGAKASDKICETDLNYFFNRMPNRWIKQAYVRGFDCESITKKNL